MKFIYQYRTPNNKQHKAFITAPTKEAAYAILKAQGIKPGRVDEAPGFFNKLFGKGKRWIAIGVLGVGCVVFCGVALRLRHAAIITEREAQFDERAQLYGDPVVIAECVESGWTNVFTSAFDCRLAAYAVPGQAVSPVRVSVPSDPCAYVVIQDDDLAEIAQMKRMVNGIKRELSEYLAAGGTVEGYLKRLDIRQRAERGIFETAQRAVKRAKTHSEWKAKNAELRAMGLPMVGTDPSEL